jgi:pimeloyl-ACP methyl ester carboxylesterase
MHVVEHGSGTPLVLLHGFGVDHRLLLPLDPVIEAAGQWRRIYLDLPGMGGTPARDVGSAEDVVTMVEDEIRQRLGAEAFAVLGISFGGMIARRVAHDFRERVLGLAAIAAVFVADREQRDVPPRTVLAEDPEVLRDLGDASEAYAEEAVVQTRDNARSFIDYVYPGMALADETALERIAEHYALDHEPEDASPSPFTQPSLFIAGRQDDVVGYRDAWARIEHYPRAAFAVLDAAGHNVHMDQAAVSAALLTDWLRRVRVGANASTEG